MTERTLSLYGAGGAGSNQVKPFIGVSTLPGYAKMDCTLIDTSDSNITDGVPEENVFILDGVDGSGKVRAQNYEVILNTTRQILLQHPFGDVAVIVFSASGGSGSVFAPIIMQEAIAKGIPIIGIVIGTHGTAKEAENTVNTLKSMDNMARKNGVPFVIIYERNRRDYGRKKVDEAIRAAILQISLLVGTMNNNSGLDSADIKNWVYFQSVTDVPAQLALLDIILNEDSAKDISDPISVASIYDEGHDAEFPFASDYGCEGFKASGIAPEHKEVHFVISISDVPQLFGMEKEQVDRYREVKNSRVVQSSLTDKNDKTTDDGMVL